MLRETLFEEVNMHLSTADVTSIDVMKHLRGVVLYLCTVDDT